MWDARGDAGVAGWFGSIAVSLSLLAMTKRGREWARWVRLRFSGVSPYAVIASPFRAWQSSLMRYAGCPGRCGG
jgi:hypothetical protein